MSISDAVYLHLPVPLKQAALDYYGRKLERRRYATAVQDEREWGVSVVQGKSWPELQALQDERLAAVARRARELSPFWADRLAGIRIEKEADLQQAPLLTKQQLRAAGRSAVCRDIEPADLVKEQTSGSTGSPMTYYLSTAAVRRNFVFYRSFRALHGYQPGQRRARFGGRLILPYSHRRPPYWLYDRTQDTIYLSLLHMSEETLADYACAVAEYQPHEISGYPSSVYLFADWCLRHGEKRIAPQRIMTDAETLLDYQRETIEEAFGCRITDSYGVSEMGTFAGQCARGTFHVFPHLVVLEVLDEAGNRCREGEVGVIHVTSLVNDAAPLIRYNTGDRGALGPSPAALGPSPAARVPGRPKAAKAGCPPEGGRGELWVPGCPCGLQTPTLTSIEGRVDDLVTTGDGRRLGRLNFIFKGSGEIRECQIVQLAPGRFRFVVVAGDAYGPKSLDRLRADAHSRLGIASEITFQVVDRIPRGPNGKFRAVVVLKPGEDAEERNAA